MPASSIEIERILAAGVTWMGLEIDAGVGTKVAAREMGFETVWSNTRFVVWDTGRSTSGDLDPLGRTPLAEP